MAKAPGVLEGVDKASLLGAVKERLRAQLEALDGVDVSAVFATVAVGSVVDVQDESARRVRHVLLPAGGGWVVGKMVNAAVVVQPETPLGQVLLGKRAGDGVVLPGGKRAVILAVG
jgi:transcription elongation GreA/GreB family factor